MKILFVAPTYFDPNSVIGGGERYVHELARALSDQASVDVFSFGPKSRQFAQDAVNFSIFRSRQFRHFTLINPFCFGHYVRIRRGTWDVVHVHQLCTFVSDIACLAASHAGIPVVGTDHGGGGAWVLNRRMRIYPRYAAVVGQSQHAAELLKADFSDCVQVIKGGVDTQTFTPAPSNRESPFVLFVGRLLPHKGVHTLVEAFVRANVAGYRLLLVGRATDPAYLDRLQTLAAGRAVEFRTSVNDAELRQLYQQASLTVLPSEGGTSDGAPPELMGFTSLESQASGTPVLVSDAGPMHEFMNEGVSGSVFRAGDVANLSERMQEVLGWYDTTPSPLIAERCAQHVQSFSWQSVASRHLELYRSFQPS